MSQIAITYLGHACFEVNKDDYKILLDPFKGVRGFKDISGTYNEVLCSHEHFDHCYKDELEIVNKPSPFNIKTIDVFHDDKKGTLRGNNKITIIEVDNKRIIHLGDLGHLLDKDIIKQLYQPDVLLMPIGGTYTINSDQAIQTIKDLNPNIIIPMHYKDNNLGLEALEDIEVFLSKASEYKDKLRLIKGYNNSISISE